SSSGRSVPSGRPCTSGVPPDPPPAPAPSSAPEQAASRPSPHTAVEPTTKPRRDSRAGTRPVPSVTDRLPVGAEDPPHVVDALAGGVAGRGVLGPQVERPAVVGDLHGAVVALDRAELGVVGARA